MEKKLEFLTQDFLVKVSLTNTDEIDKEIVFSQLNKIKQQINFTDSYSHKVHYINIPISFDIETSSFTEGIAKKAIMYIWTLNINGVTFIGRTWNQFIELLNLISETYQLNKYNKRVLIFVHNLEYEFQFMRKWLEWYDIFADSQRAPLYAITTNGIEFRCSYKLSGYSLAKLSDELTTYKTNKMVGDLDYKLIRHSNTPLTETELHYCTQDTKVVVCYIQELIERLNGIANIPYTKTGFVRRYCQNYCINTPKNLDDRISRFKYKDLIKSLQLNKETYELSKEALQGGFVHGNVNYINKTIRNVGSYDFTSAYPFVMVSEKFPMSTPKEIEIKTYDDLEFYCKNYCCLIDIELYDVKPLVTFENPISISRCKSIKGEFVNNGRIVSAEYLRITITELDLDTYKQFYYWSKMKIIKAYAFYKAYLPKLLIECVIKFYKDKTTLKGVEGKEVEYLNSKGMLNSTYGMAVTDIVRDMLEYDNTLENGWDITHADTFSQLNKYNNNPSRFLYYPWGVWVTAYNRHNLFKGILEFKNDYVYSDTDSIKAINCDKHIEFIKNYNLHVREKLETVSGYYNIPMSDFEPKTIKGVSKLIGVWDFEGTYDKFKTLGAKRYLVKHGNDIEFTVAGCNKKALKEYMIDTYGIDNDYDNIFNAFTRNLDIPANKTGKLTHTYIDTELEGYIIDYQNTPFHYYEKSVINLSDAPFKISMIDAFWDYITSVQQIEK